LDNHFVIAGTSAGLMVYSPDNHQFIPLINEKMRGTIQKVSQILPFGKDSLVVLVNKKVFLLDHSSGSWQFSNALFAMDTECEHLWISPDKQLYAFTLNGFLIWQKESIVFNKYTRDGKDALVDVNSAQPCDSKNLWLATNNGLIKMDLNGRISHWYTELDGLPNHYLYGLIKDHHGHLWISSNGGLSFFDPAATVFINYQPEDGLQSREFNSGAYYLSPSGWIYFGGINGYNWFNPDSVSHEKSSTIVMLTGIRVNDQEFLADTCPMALNELTFHYTENTLTFEFAAINYEKPGKSSLEYKLEGYDKGWIYAGQNNHARYPRLIPGRYLFRVRELYSNDEESPLSTLAIEIRKPFWMLPSFLISAGISILVILYLIVRYFTVMKMKRRIALLEHQREINSVRTRIASDLHDDIGSGLSKLAMMLDTTRLGQTSEAELKNRLEILSQKTRMMGDQLRIIVWALHPQDDHLSGLISYIRLQISEFLDEHHLILDFNEVSQIPAIVVTAEFRRNVYYSIREAVHNSIKHSGGSQIRIHIGIELNQLILHIEDNGKGFDPEATHSYGQGLRIIKSRIQALGGTVSILSKPGEGTKISLQIPFRAKNTT
jgi:signal transduction histidine kinase